jgi:hypothetical protein
MRTQSTLCAGAVSEAQGVGGDAGDMGAGVAATGPGVSGGPTLGSAGAIKGSHVGELPRKSRQYETDRICSHPGCITKISKYNRRETCFAHAGVKIPRLRGRKVASV